MSHFASASAYDRFMGRFSEPLAELFVREVGLSPGRRALDVGCGPGALTARLVEVLGPDAVAAVDPSAPFVAAARARFPQVDVRRAGVETLPFADHTFDLVLAQLVVHFLADPVAGLREMRRVARPGGTVAASVWDHGSTGGPLAVFQRAVQDVDPGASDESDLPGTHEGQLPAYAHAAGLREVAAGSLTVRLTFEAFEDWWLPFTLGIGPAGAYVGGLDDDGRARLAARCAELVGPPPFTVQALAWCVRGVA